MRRNNVLTWIALGSLAVLVGIELLTHYDTWPRQVALSFTSIIGGGIYLLVFVKLRRQQIVIPWIAAWLVALGIWFDAAGNFAGLYGRILWWDKPAHCVSSMAVTAVFWFIIVRLNQQGRIRLSSWLINLFSVSLTMLISSIYEVTELIGDSFWPTNRITDLYDSADDLMWNLLGAIFIVLICQLVKNKKTKTPFDKES
ncbi:hypothetical protein KKG41_05290 [Patescibacteria group bacterium]|nr:hypothetical protein [Patescibacteria group bacterium]MBU1890950.1 hypothetical protein [Patescibacteria group bacterium]